MVGRFGDDAREFFEGVYQGTPPWEVGGAQPDMAALLLEFPPEGPVLDLGCGSGDLAIHIGRSGLDVLGIDFVASAIDRAREKADEAGAEVARRVRFEVGDASRPAEFGRDFGAVVDSGFMHVLSVDQGDALVDGIARVLRPGGRFYLHAFDVDFPVPNTPRRISREEVLERFHDDRGWKVLSVRAGRFHAAGFDPVPATLACVEWTGEMR